MSPSAFEVMHAGGAFDSVLKERIVLDKEFGSVQHPTNNWCALLADTVGTVCRRSLETEGYETAELISTGDIYNFRRACVRAAAVAIAMIERVDLAVAKSKHEAAMKKAV